MANPRDINPIGCDLNSSTGAGCYLGLSSLAVLHQQSCIIQRDLKVTVRSKTAVVLISSIENSCCL